MTDGIVAQDPFIGTTLDDRYSVVSLISRGGLSVLYRGVDKATSKPVTVRVLHEEKNEREANAARFLSAVKLMESVKHPNIVPILGSGTTSSGAPYLVLPFVDGRSIRDKVDKDGPLTYEQALPIINDIASALEHAHKHGVVHRNLKPSNILLTDVDGKQRAVLTGFGIAKKVPTGSGESISRTSKVVGSPLYMSPEQFLNSKVDGRSDIYSFGCVLHQMLCGKPPFDAPSLVQLMGAHHHRYREHFAPELKVPGFVDDVLDAATMKMPANRYANALQIVADLQAGKCSIDLNAARRHEPAAGEQDVQRQQTIKTAAIITAGSVLVVALVIFIAGFDSMTRVHKHEGAEHPVPETKVTKAQMKKMIDNAQYNDAKKVVSSQLSLADAAGERTEVLREKLAMLMFLNNERNRAREPLEKAIETRRSIAEAEPDTKVAQERSIRNDYALLALTYINEAPEKALEIVETQLKGFPLETVPEQQVVNSLEAHWDLDRIGMRLREEFHSGASIGYTGPEDAGQLSEYLISETEKE